MPAPGRRAFRRALIGIAALTLAPAFEPASARAWQAGAARPAPPIESGRPAPPLDRGRPESAPPGFSDRPAPGVGDPGRDTGRRYRFIESYAQPDANDSGIGPYQVAFVENLDRSFEQPGQAPERTQLVARAIVVERPARVGGVENRTVSALVRYYQTVQLTKDGVPDTSADGPAGLAGQTLWLQDDGRPAPTILTLPGSAPLNQEQFGFAAIQQVDLPKLGGLLSVLHQGVGSSWNVPRDAAEALVGDVILDGSLVATFEELLPPTETDQNSRAVIRVSGRVQLVSATTAVNAQLEFAFVDPETTLDGPQGGGQVNRLEPRMIDAQGSINRLLLAQRDVVEFPDATGRIGMRATQLRELNLERRRTVPADLIPPFPNPPLEPNRQNSWVVFLDPDDRFQFEHPQDYRPAPADEQAGEDVVLQRVRTDGVPDHMTFVFHPRGEVPPELRPDPFVQRMVEGWRSIPPPGVQVGQGSEGWLPEPEWGGKRVYRLELPLTYSPEAFAVQDAGRAYSSAYLVQLPNGSALELMSLTEGSPAEFREQVEEILRSFRVDPPSPAAPRAGVPARRPGANATPAPASVPEPEPEPEPGAEPGPGADVPPVQPGTGIPPVEPEETPAPPPTLDPDPSRRPPPPPID